ncbi:hypothetical protein MAR_030042 [Mya arenaria]|uniref:Uncharacterized protein n=1 Tax=Mya arenaria TaxID=6604 RepID=A0ABY7DKX0_MYAAR|nr:hypothetical protein MAR_030042 [Mya arenaria]
MTYYSMVCGKPKLRKSVFKQKCANPNVYAFSKDVQGHRTPLTVEDLKSNVLLLDKGAFDIPTPDGDSHLLEPGIPAWFNVTYEDDIAVYAVELTRDYKAGDVVIRRWLLAGGDGAALRQVTLDQAAADWGLEK